MTLHRYDLYGLPDGELDELARRLQTVLPVELEPRSSLYRGEYYNWRGAHGGHLVLQANLDEEDGLPTETDFAEHPVLLYASELPVGWFDDILALDGAVRLRSELRP